MGGKIWEVSAIQSPVPVPRSGAPAPQVTRAIYGMPMFATFEVADLDATVAWYVDALGFIDLFTVPGPSGPALVHLRRWQFQDLVVRPATGSVSPGTGCTISFAAVYEDIDAVAERARSHGGGRVDGPVDTPWNTQDVTTTDPDGHVVIFTAARPEHLADPAFSEQMQRWNEKHGLASH